MILGADAVLRQPTVKLSLRTVIAGAIAAPLPAPSSWPFAEAKPGR
ncbi:hypothetical protein ABZT47_38870 [Sphaerisporangium sp. NPDC005289]